MTTVEPAGSGYTPTGPLGRLARLALVALCVASFASIADQGGPASFRGPNNLLEPSLLLLDAVMAALFVSLVGVIARTLGGTGEGRRVSVGAWTVLGAAVGIAAAIGQFANGTIWASPLSDLVWWFDALMLLETIAALLTAVVIGLPGCEIGVWALVVNHLRRQRASIRPYGCVVGLHLIDAWEASRRDASDA